MTLFLERGFMRIRKANDEVFYADEPIVRVGSPEIEFLKERAEQNERKRARLCAHTCTDDKLHEMVIVLKKEAYIRPHKHLNKTESFHIIEGMVDVVIFDEDGRIVDVVEMGDYSTARNLYYRLSDPYYHTVLIRSDFLVFHETTDGPFDRSKSIFAPWAPEETDYTAGREYTMRLTQEVESFLASGKRP